VSPQQEALALLPELLVLVGAVAALLAGSFLPRTRQWIAQGIASLALVAAATAGALSAGAGTRTVYGSSYALDVATSTARIIIPAAALLTIALATGRVRGNPRESEFFVLVLLASLGAMLLAGASDVLLLSVGYLLASIPLYALAGWGRDPRGAEAALKTYLLGALLGIVMLLGVSVLYGVGGGSTTYAALGQGLPLAPPAAVGFGTVALLAGLLFKVGAVPAHFWVPDAVDGATVPAGAFVTTVPKIGGLIALYRVVLVIPDTHVSWRLLLALVAAASMTLGNFAAFRQDSPRRLLAYSTISQVGYLLMAVTVAGRTPAALPALLLYVAGYAVTNLGAFAVVAALPQLRTLSDYRGIARSHPALAGVLLVCLLGLVGTPPTVVFIGKLSVFTATWQGGQSWLVVVAAVNTVASLYYYLRWLAPSFSVERPPRHPAGRPQRPAAWSAHGAAATSAVTAATVSVLLGLGAGWGLHLAAGTLVR
jgi:NADH-quinone oxidoreductase subunit N